jgi:hypothetical protein
MSCKIVLYNSLPPCKTKQAMQERIPKYLNPYTDFWFKKLFGEEANKELLTDFLNQILS